MEEIKQETSEYVDFGELSFVKLMGELLEIKGYRASAIMTYDGEILYSNTAVISDNNLTSMMGGLNKFFGQACNLTEQSGFISCAEVSLRTGDDIMVIRCSGKDCLVGIRLLVCIEEHGNVALLQARLKNLLPRIMKCIVWEPDNLVPLFMSEMRGAGGEMPVEAGCSPEAAVN